MSHADAIQAAHAAAADKINRHPKHDAASKLKILLTHVNDTTDQILKSTASADDKIALLQAFVDSNKTGGIDEIIALAGVK